MLEFGLSNLPLRGIKATIPLEGCWAMLSCGGDWRVRVTLVRLGNLRKNSVYRHDDADGRCERHCNEQDIVLPVTDKPVESSVRRRLRMLTERLNLSRKWDEECRPQLKCGKRIDGGQG